MSEQQIDQQAPTYEERDYSRRFEPFEVLLEKELEHIREEGRDDYIIFKKFENPHLRRKPRGIPEGVMYQKRTVPLVVWLANAGVTENLLSKYESKGWLIVASSFSEKARLDAKKDHRIGDVISHCEAVLRYAQAGVPVVPGRSATQRIYEEALAKREQQQAQAKQEVTIQEVKPRGRPKKQHQGTEGSGSES